MLVLGFARTGYRDYALNRLITLLLEETRNKDAWDEFFDRFDESIHHMAAAAVRKHLGSCSSAEACDFVQQVYIRLIENDCQALRNFRGTTVKDFQAYLARICYNLVLDRSVAQATISITSETASLEEDSYPGGFQPVSEPNQERVLERRELRELIENSLRQLGHDKEARRNRLVFILRHYDGYSAKEVAELLQITAEHVDTIYHRVKKKVVIDLANALNKKNHSSGGV